jgi:hypothetical protein
MSINKLAYA